MTDEATPALPAVRSEAVRSFVFHDLPIRAAERAGEVWFVLSDCCRVLGVGNSRDAAARLDEDQRGVDNIDTPGGPQSMTIVNESGLYALILTSRKPEARDFRRWVCGEVIPEIRRSGGYRAAAVMTPDVERLARVLVAEQSRQWSELLATALPAAINRSLEKRFSGMALSAAGARSAVLPASVMDDRRLAPRDWAIVAILARSADAGGWVTLSLGALGALAGLSRSAAQRAVDRLVETGHVERFAAPIGPVGKEANSYRIADRSSPGSVGVPGLPLGASPARPQDAERDRLLSAFLADCTDRDPAASTPGRELYRAYCGWCVYRDVERLSETMFGRTLPGLGLTKSGGRLRLYRGVRVRPGSFPPASC